MITYKDILDIFIVTFIIYRIILLIRGTRAVQMLLGLAFVIILFFMARIFELYTLYWMMDNFLSSIIIIIIVIFQHDIRRALTRVGNNPFLWSINKYTSDVIDSIVGAAVTLSKRRIGALIVIERETGLKDFIEHGTKIDAYVSSELLISIFLPTSPIHDGAVIIEKDKISSAGCFLPLTSNISDVSKLYGTRHRAAIGISERTDAVVVVVSEETGQISIALDGKIKPYCEEKELKEFLSKSLKMI